MKTQIIIIAALMAFVSCKKDKIEDPNSTPGTQLEFKTPKTVGSYWVYQRYQIDENGIETLLPEKDSIYVYGDTTINNLKYTIYKGNKFGQSNYTSIERDSSGYIVNHKGGILYSYTKFNDTIDAGSAGQMWDWYTTMINNIQVEVPVGTFNAIESRETYFKSSGEPANNCGDEFFTLSKWYTKDIGKIKAQYGYISEIMNCKYKEARLIEYYNAP